MTALARFAPFVQSGVTFDAGRHVYEFEGHPVMNVTGLLRRYRISRDWSDIPEDVLEEKREIGRAAHIASHYDDEGDLQPGTVAPEVEPYVEAWRTFKRELKFKPLLLETILVHPLLRYGGTVDRLGIVEALGMTPSVVDLKTGDPDDAGAGPQTAAYEQLVRACFTPITMALHADRSMVHWLEREWSSPWTRYSVQLLPSGRYKLHTYQSHRDLQRFMWALSLDASAHPSWRAIP